ncbi:MAG: hypothetical protein IJC25_01645 [Clostridia bacterium]|nr:hypothetical protein [Clostridia bacterium]
MQDIKNSIEQFLEETADENDRLRQSLTDACRLTDYAPDGDRWTAALQQALDCHQIVVIPAAEQPYLLDGTVVIPSDRHIIAEEGAVIRLVSGTEVLMLRNEHTADGTHAPVTTPRARNISISGGVWEECCTQRMGYGKSGKYDAQRSFYGISTCMLFENLDHLTLRGMTFRNCGGFAVQLGEISNVIIENIRFEGCFADGIHVNGNTKNIRISDVSGQVGDDLVALNMYDWQDSSINFGPAENVLCEDLTLSEDSSYKALRILTGIYRFDDGSTVDCALNNAVLRRIKGIKVFKLYCQTPAFKVGQAPEAGEVGSGNNIVFEDIDIDLRMPLECFDEYINSHPIKGSFAAFELGLNLKNLYFNNISVTLDRERFPYSYFACIGPKSVRIGDTEIFDPQFSSVAEHIYLQNIRINGQHPEEISPYLREIVFDHLYDDLPSTSSGRILNVHYQ